MEHNKDKIIGRAILMNDILRIARLKIALQRAFLGQAILRVIPDGANNTGDFHDHQITIHKHDHVLGFLKPK